MNILQVKKTLYLILFKIYNFCIIIKTTQNLKQIGDFTNFDTTITIILLILYLSLKKL